MEGQKNVRSFWQRPEGVTGGLVIAALVIAAAGLIVSAWPVILQVLSTGIGLTFFLVFLGLLLYMVLDVRMRGMIWFFYKKSMRWITGLFIKIDPILVLKTYVSDLNGNVRKMRRQMGQLRGQMHQLREITFNNNKQIREELELAHEARAQNKRNVMVLKTRKAARLKESTDRLDDLYNRMEILYRVLGKMYENSEILLEDISDQVHLKEQERKAILAGRSAMESAMSVISGSGDKKEIFDQALEAVADDVSRKVGEMEEFIVMSEEFMNSIDLQSGVFQEKGLKMLEKWERESDSMFLGAGKEDIILSEPEDKDPVRLKIPLKKPDKDLPHQNQYDSFFD